MDKWRYTPSIGDEFVTRGGERLEICDVRYDARHGYEVVENDRFHAVDPYRILPSSRGLHLRVFHERAA